jgi:hypothetical protein
MSELRDLGPRRGYEGDVIHLGVRMVGAVAALSYLLTPPQQFQSHFFLVVAVRSDVIPRSIGLGSYLTPYGSSRHIGLQSYLSFV